MAIRVEFYGIVRQRAGVSEILLDPPQGRQSTTLGNVLEHLANQFPQLGVLLRDGQLDASLTANLDGARFVADRDTQVSDGQCLLVLSADAGG